MACKFSFFLKHSDSFKENDVGIFKSDNMEQYIVRYKSNVCRDLLLKIEWTIPKQILVTVKLYTTTLKRCFSSKGIVVNGKKLFLKLRGAFNVSNSRDYKILCIINLIPYITISDWSEFKSESLESGYLTTGSQSMITDDEKSFVDNELKYKNADERVFNNISTMEVHEMNVSVESINSESVFENEYQSNNEGNYLAPSNVLTDSSKIKESNIVTNFTYDSDKSKISTTSANNNNLDKCNQIIRTQANEATHETSEENLESLQVLENDQILKKNFEEDNDVQILHKVHANICESETLNDISNEMNDLDKDRLKDVLVNEKMLTLSNFDEEVSRSLNSTIDKVVVSKNTFAEKKLTKDVDSLEIAEKNLVSYQNNLSYPNLNEGDSLNNKTSTINQAPEIELDKLIENENESYSANEDETAISTANVEDNSIRESNDVSMKDNQMFEKDLTDLSDYESCSHTKSRGSVAIQNNDQPLTESSTSSLIHKTSVAPGDVEIDNKMIDTEESASAQFPSSKTRFLFETLVQKLATTDCDLESTNKKPTKSKRSSKKKLDKTKTFPVMESELKGLSMDMLELLTSGDFADAVIANNDKMIKVHRYIICSRSPVFKKMFIKHTQDDIQYQAIVDIPSIILEDIIVFLYTGLIQITSTKMAQDVLEIAEKYIINDLIEICSKYVKK